MEEDLGIELGSHSKYGDLFTIKEFSEMCESGCFIDYDGNGHLATEDKESDIIIHPSTLRESINDNPWATHIMWYNR